MKKIMSIISVFMMAALFFAGCAGIWLFVENGIPGYLIFQTHFAFFDCGKPAVLVFLENLAMLFAFIFAGANIVRLMRAVRIKKVK